MLIYFKYQLHDKSFTDCNFPKSVSSHLLLNPFFFFLIDACKVEFIQPSNWLYSVPNLLVIQHLVTLYLGGFDVRVVSEIE